MSDMNCANCSCGISHCCLWNGGTLIIEEVDLETFSQFCVGRSQLRMLIRDSADVRYIQPRAYFKLEDHRFDKLPMVGEGQWDDALPLEGDDSVPQIDVPMAQIVRN